MFRSRIVFAGHTQTPQAAFSPNTRRHFLRRAAALVPALLPTTWTLGIGACDALAATSDNALRNRLAGALGERNPPGRP